MLSCLRPIHMFDRNIRQELSSTVPSPSGMLSSFVARYASWLKWKREMRSYPSDVLLCDAAWCPSLHLEERIVHGRKVAREKQGRDASLVRLETRWR